MTISHKKLAAKKRIGYQLRNANSGQFAMQYSDSEDEYKYESSDNDYSTDSSDENYCTQRILKLGNISFIWTNKGLIFFLFYFKFIFKLFYNEFNKFY